MRDSPAIVFPQFRSCLYSSRPLLRHHSAAGTLAVVLTGRVSVDYGSSLIIWYMVDLGVSVIGLKCRSRAAGVLDKGPTACGTYYSPRTGSHHGFEASTCEGTTRRRRVGAENSNVRVGLRTCFVLAILLGNGSGTTYRESHPPPLSRNFKHQTDSRSNASFSNLFDGFPFTPVLVYRKTAPCWGLSNATPTKTRQPQKRRPWRYFFLILCLPPSHTLPSPASAPCYRPGSGTTHRMCGLNFRAFPHGLLWRPHTLVDHTIQSLTAALTNSDPCRRTSNQCTNTYYSNNTQLVRPSSARFGTPAGQSWRRTKRPSRCAARPGRGKRKKWSPS